MIQHCQRDWAGPNQDSSAVAPKMSVIWWLGHGFKVTVTRTNIPWINSCGCCLRWSSMVLFIWYNGISNTEEWLSYSLKSFFFCRCYHTYHTLVKYASSRIIFWKCTRFPWEILFELSFHPTLCKKELLKAVSGIGHRQWLWFKGVVPEYKFNRSQKVAQGVLAIGRRGCNSDNNWRFPVYL